MTNETGDAGRAAEREGPRRLRSLRRMVAWTLAGLALAVAVGQASFLFWTTYRFEEWMIDRELDEQLQRSIALHRSRPELAAPNTADLRLYVAPGGDVSRLPDFLRGLPLRAAQHELEPREGVEYHVAVGEDGGTWFFLVYDVAEHTARQRNVQALLAMSVLGAAGVALALGGWLAGRLTGDLETLSRAVREPAPPGADGLEPLARHRESAELAGAIDGYRARLERSLAREREFSAAASHELRTPLMRAGSAADLLRDGAGDARQLRLLGQLRDSLNEIRMLTDGLLRVARGTTRESLRPLGVAELVDEAFAHLRDEAQARRIELASDVGREAEVRADRAALWIVLTNLLRNAIRHSGGSRVEVSWRDGILTVADDGSGIEPGERPTRGLGMGLTIVERICEAAGWQARLEPRAPHGTVVRVTLEGGSGHGGPSAPPA